MSDKLILNMLILLILLVHVYSSGDIIVLTGEDSIDDVMTLMTYYFRHTRVVIEQQFI